MLVLVGCDREQEAQECAFLSEGYASFDNQEIKRLPTSGTRRVPLARFAQVQSCWAAKPFGGDNQYSLEYVETRWVSDTEYYLIFEPVGITDVHVGFLINEPQGAVKAGTLALF